MHNKLYCIAVCLNIESNRWKFKFFIWHSGTSCTNINECNGTNTQCDPNAVCQDTEGSFSCICESGYNGTGLSCQDINECDISSNCQGTSTCSNTNGSFTCNCTTGFSYNGTTCVDINECENSETCPAQANCTNTEGSFNCMCKSGFTGDGNSCVDIDECNEANPCVSNGCQNNIGSFICVCKEGYTETDNVLNFELLVVILKFMSNKYTSTFVGAGIPRNRSVMVMYYIKLWSVLINDCP